MEKFTVDLDRVLDEFEYNEDCAERTAGCGRKTYRSLSSDMFNRYAQDEIPVKTSGKLCEGAVKKDSSENAFPSEDVVMNSFLSSQFGDGGVPYEMKLKELFECNSRQCSSKLLTMSTTNTMKDENDSLLHCKLNVSGVFSCLNEYINSGNVSHYKGHVDDKLKDESKSENLLMRKNCDVSDYEISGHEASIRISESDNSCGEKPSVDIANFQQHADILCNCSADNEESITIFCSVTDEVDLQGTEKEVYTYREKNTFESNMAVQRISENLSACAKSASSYADLEDTLSTKEESGLNICVDEPKTNLDGDEKRRMDSVLSIQCQKINGKLEMETIPSNEVLISKSNEKAIEINSMELGNYLSDTCLDDLCAPNVKHCVMNGIGKNAICDPIGERHNIPSEGECGNKCSISSKGAGENRDTSNKEPENATDYSINADCNVANVNAVAAEIEAVEYTAASSTTTKDVLVPSRPSLEPSVEDDVNQCQSHMNSTNNEAQCASEEHNKLGTIPPLWIPDDKAPSCMLCFCKFTVLKRRHHCRACGKVFCSKCCCLKYRLHYLNHTEVRVCQLCHDALVKGAGGQCLPKTSDLSSTDLDSRTSIVGRQPNPNNPMEYCSTIPPLEQAASVLSQPVPSVLVPVGVLKREGCTRLKSDVTKQVMFSDGIRPGGDLTELDASPDRQIIRQSDVIAKRIGNLAGTSCTASRSRSSDRKASLFSTNGIPPLAVIQKGKLKLEDLPIDGMSGFLSELRCETKAPAVFALNQNLFVQLKILNLDCCVNRVCWCFSTVGMGCVGQDEILIILECLPTDCGVPKDIFHFLNTLYHDASNGILVNEMNHTTFKTPAFLGSTEHGGFLYIRPSFQCLHKIILPSAPYLVGILIHRWEIPWAKLFPIRLMLRLGAEFRYYPCMLVSVQQREPVYCEIGHTIMNLLADFRNMSYTLPSVRGMVIHMEDKHTSVLLPKNRYDQVARALNNSNDHVLALAANFSLDADSHLVCIQSSTDDSYHTQAINIHNKPRKVTGASFVVFNGALKISSNLMAKSTIVEDGLMVQITPDTIQQLRSSLHKMKNFIVHCGPTSASVPDETVDIRWIEDDHNFNIGVQSVIDGMALDGVPSIRVHNGSDFLGKTRFIRWTEVFILQPGSISDGMMGANDAVDVSRVAENLATAACMALCDFLDLLAQGGFTRIGVRANIHQDNVGYAVGSRGEKLPPIYMKTLDSTLVPVLHHTATVVSNSSPVVLELIFHIMLR